MGALRATAVTWPVCVTFSPVGEVRTPKHLEPPSRFRAPAPLRPSSRRKVTAAIFAGLTFDPARLHAERRRTRTASAGGFGRALVRPGRRACAVRSGRCGRQV